MKAFRKFQTVADALETAPELAHGTILQIAEPAGFVMVVRNSVGLVATREELGLPISPFHSAVWHAIEGCYA